MSLKFRWLAALLIAAALWCAGASASTASGTCGNGVEWEVDENGTLIFSGTGAIPDYPYGGRPWDAYEVTAVEIGEGITEIGENAIANGGITSVTIPAGVTRVESDSFTSFSLSNFYVDSGNEYYSAMDGVLFDKQKTTLIRCPINKLGEYTIPAGVTTIGKRAFAWCSLNYVTIPGSVASIGEFAFDYSCLLSVTIQNGVSSIGNYAFWGCDCMTEITIPASVASIGMSPFAYCECLTDIAVDSGNEYYSSADGVLLNKEQTTIVAYPSGKGTENVIPAGVTAIGDGAFCGCLSLTDVTIPEGVTSIGTDAFCQSENLRSVTLPNSLTSIGNGAFRLCRLLQNPAIPEGVTSIGAYAFDGIWQSGHVTIPDSVTSIGEGAFFTNHLTSVTISANVTSISKYTFGNSHLTEVTIPYGVTAIGDEAFESCDYLTTVTIPASVTSIGDAAFKSCTRLKDVYYSGSLSQWEEIRIGTDNEKLIRAAIHTSEIVGSGACGENVEWTLNEAGLLTVSGTGPMADYQEESESIPWAGCRDAIRAIRIEDGVTGIGSHAFSGCVNLTDTAIAGSVTGIGAGAFSYCTRLANAPIPDGVTGIGDYTFHCTGLTSVAIPDGVTSIGKEAFSQCGSLAEAPIPDSVTSIGDEAFAQCAALAEMTIPDSVTSLGAGVFAGCGNLAAIAVDSGNPAYYAEDGVVFDKYRTTLVAYPAGREGAYEIPSGVTSIGDCAFMDTKLTGVEIPDTVNSIGHDAFYGTGLTKVEIPDGVTRIESMTFTYCGSLANVKIPDTVTFIGMFAFANCSSLTDVRIPAGVTSLGDYAFENTGLKSAVIPEGITDVSGHLYSGCRSLAKVSVPVGVARIRQGAFDGCNGLKDVYYTGSSKQWNKITIDSDNEKLTAAQLHPNSAALKAVGTCESNLDWRLDVYGNLTVSGSGRMVDFTQAEGGTPWYYYTDLIKAVHIEEGVTGIGKNAFRDCSSLTEATIADSVTAIGDSAFFRTGLTEVKIPRGMTSIGAGAFYGCFALERVSIPDGITSIGKHAFYMCSALKYAVIPASVASIGKSAFLECNTLAVVYYFGTGDQWEQIRFGTGNEQLTGAEIRFVSGDRILTLPANLTAIESETFAHVPGADCVYIPATVTKIAADAFDAGIVIITPGGSYAEKWAKDHGFVAVNP